MVQQQESFVNKCLLQDFHWQNSFFQLSETKPLQTLPRFSTIPTYYPSGKRALMANKLHLDSEEQNSQILTDSNWWWTRRRSPHWWEKSSKPSRLNTNRLVS
ncbi:unnamed protein product [Blepharisma stoltei]|uniref:Uncharacterized protein n=1 Tax=Blepharisma stoltei TaxID=1481888 RepID=A0AAU9KB38_9CILI|nr:unnamed protein product [Blepharisma stoltei]